MDAADRSAWQHADRLFAELIRRGWSDANLARLARGNILRALLRAEAVAGEMKDVPPLLATLEPSGSPR